MLSSFHVENYKCLKNVTLPLTPMHVLIGQNDAGKSSLLEALYAFFRSSQETLEQAFSGHWQRDDLVYEGATDPIVKFEGTFDDFGKYGFHAEFLRGSGHICSTVEEWYQRETLAAMSIVGRGNTATTVAAQRMNSGPLAEKDIAIQQIKALLDGVHLYRLDPRLMAIPSGLSVRRFRLDRDGFGLPGLLDEILGYDIERFAKIRSQFLRFFPQYRNVRIETEPATSREFSETGRHVTRESIGKGIHFETHSHRSIRAQQASDGAILFLGFLALANLPHPPKMLLIEEPETGIYPERLAQVIQLLRGIGTTPQIVFTTHSPYVLSLFQPEEVTYMSRGSDGIVRARPLRDAPHIRERLEGFYLGELWYNLSEQELFADADASHDGLILVEIFGEGRTDIGTESVVCLPDKGVVPILISRLCDKPAQMRVKTKRHAHLQGKGLSQKVQFAKRQARYNPGTKAGVFVQDTRPEAHATRPWQPRPCSRGAFATATHARNVRESLRRSN